MSSIPPNRLAGSMARHGGVESILPARRAGHQRLFVSLGEREEIPSAAALGI